MMALRRWWFAPAPAERVAALRIFVGSFALAWMLVRWVDIMAVARLPATNWRPVGVTRVLDAPLPTSVVLVVSALTTVLLVGFVAGWRYRMVAPLAAAAFLWTTTYRTSWGMTFHTENLTVLHLIALACAPAADAYSLDARRRPASEPAAGYGWIVKLLVALTVATYLLAGIAKLRIAGAGWLDGEHLRNQIAIDNLRKAVLGDGIAPFAELFLEHPRALTIFCVLTLVLELGAPLALFGPRVGALWALGAWSFHVGVVLLMNIWFLYPLLGVAFLPLLRAERPIAWLVRRRRPGM